MDDEDGVSARPRGQLVDRWRPQIFEQIIGQPELVRLPRQLRSGRPPSLLFTGPTGVGKSTAALITARALLCEQPTPSGSPCRACENCQSFATGRPFDYEECNAAQLSTAVMAEMLELSRANPLTGKWRVYFLDEVHNLTPKAFEMLLRVLENPRHRVFILATTLPEKVPKPIRDRLTRYELKLVDRETSLRHLVTICKAEGFAFELPGLRLLTEPGPAAVSSGRRRRARGAAGRSTCPSRGRFSSGRRARP